MREQLPLAKTVGVDGYYVRIGPIDLVDDMMPPNGVTVIKNRPDGQSQWRAVDIVSPDALALVRFGMRSAHDPRILNTVRVIDHLLKVDLPQGPVWQRYNEDGYGEHEDGRPFDGSGIGRAWPLLTGERAHYEIAAGQIDEAAETAAHPRGVRQYRWPKFRSRSGTVTTSKSANCFAARPRVPPCR